ncbi:MAG: PfkB family carbohydrate kinase [Myxococcota bacterium]
MTPEAESYVVVAGAAHLDVLASMDDEARGVDRPGKVHFAPGGTAFNIAISLKRSRFRVRLATILNSRALSGRVVADACRQHGIGTSLIGDNPRGPEAAFVGIREQDELVRAVSTTSTETSLWWGPLKPAIEGAKAVVCDCNLRRRDLSMVREVAGQAGVPIIVAGVSEAKIERVRPRADAKTEVFDLLCLQCNEREFAALCQHLMLDCPLVPSADSPHLGALGAQVCRKMRSQCVLVTHGEAGMTFLYADGHTLHSAAPGGLEVTSSCGAGDAVTAAVAGHVCSAQALPRGLGDQVMWNERAARHLEPVLRSKSANTVSIFPDELVPYTSGHGWARYSRYHSLARLIRFIWDVEPNSKLTPRFREYAEFELGLQKRSDRKWRIRLDLLEQADPQAAERLVAYERDRGRGD